MRMSICVGKSGGLTSWVFSGGDLGDFVDHHPSASVLTAVAIGFRMNKELLHENSLGYEKYQWNQRFWCSAS